MLPRSPISKFAWWAIPPLLCLAIYWDGLRVWFQMDDFAWLGLHRQIHDFPSFAGAMFRPLAQGTIRPWSERLFFLLGWEVAGFESVRLLRVIVFLTQFANLALLADITRRITGSAAAGLIAPILWLCNSNLYEPMSWTAVYNQIQCACFILSALWLWIRHIETGQWKFYWWQWAVFVLGFGSLELNVVYPALAALYALCFARPFIRRAIPLFAVSALYTLVHRLSAPESKDTIYKMFFDASLLQNLWTYLQWTFGIERYARRAEWPLWPHYAMEAVTGGALLILILVMIRRRQWLAAFGTGWFFIVLAPLLPLKNHVTDYYLTIPLIGLCMVAAWGIARAFASGRIVGTLAVAVALMYAVPGVIMARAMTHQYLVSSRRARTLVRNVAYAHRLHPDKTIVIRNVDSELFWAVWWDFPFPILGRSKIYVSAESEDHIEKFPQGGSLARFFLSTGEILAGLNSGTLVGYEVGAGDRLRNITSIYRGILATDPDAGLPKYIDFAIPASSVYLKEGWWDAEDGFRWSARRPVFRIRGPVTDHGEITIRGFSPKLQIEGGPLKLSVSIDGKSYPAWTLTPDKLVFDLRYPLPAEMKGKASMEVAVEVERTVRVPGDKRDLGVGFWKAEVLE